MATRLTILTTVLLFFFFITLSRARDLQNALPETTTRSKPQQYDTVSFNLNSVDHVPLTFLDFRPINRHINRQQQRSLPLDLPLSHRGCRHNHRRQIPYGNDMILSNDANSKDRRIPKRLTSFRGNGEGQMMYMVMEPRQIHYDHDHDQDHHHHHHHDHHHEKGWFVKKIRELLNLF